MPSFDTAQEKNSGLFEHLFSISVGLALTSTQSGRYEGQVFLVLALQTIELVQLYMGTSESEIG